MPASFSINGQGRDHQVDDGSLSTVDVADLKANARVEAEGTPSTSEGGGCRIPGVKKVKDRARGRRLTCSRPCDSLDLASGSLRADGNFRAPSTSQSGTELRGQQQTGRRPAGSQTTCMSAISVRDRRGLRVALQAACRRQQPSRQGRDNDTRIGGPCPRSVRPVRRARSHGDHSAPSTVFPRRLDTRSRRVCLLRSTRKRRTARSRSACEWTGRLFAATEVRILRTDRLGDSRKAGGERALTRFFCDRAAAVSPHLPASRTHDIRIGSNAVRPRPYGSPGRRCVCETSCPGSWSLTTAIRHLARTIDGTPGRSDGKDRRAARCLREVAALRPFLQRLRQFDAAPRNSPRDFVIDRHNFSQSRRSSRVRCGRRAFSASGSARPLSAKRWRSRASTHRSPVIWPASRAANPDFTPSGAGRVGFRIPRRIEIAHHVGAGTSHNRWSCRSRCSCTKRASRRA
jgi:hypothetical protein